MTSLALIRLLSDVNGFISYFKVGDWCDDGVTVHGLAL